MVGFTDASNENLNIPATFQSGGTWYRVTAIGENAFQRATKLYSVTIPASVASIGTRAFYYCLSLASVTFAGGSQLKTIGTEAFKENSVITSLSIPDGTTIIGEKAFHGCRNMTHIEIPASVTMIGSRALAYTDITHFVFKGTVAQWSAINKGADWNLSCPATYVQCSDGTCAP